MLDRLRQIAIFAKTVEAGSFRGAAGLLELSPSVVSYHVAQLEKQLGVALLYRSTRKLSLTRDGERLLKSAQIMLEAAESGLDSITSGLQAIGELHISLPAVMAVSPLMQRIAAFSKTHPRVKLQLNFTDLRQDIVAEGIDIAIRMGWLEDSNLKARLLGQAPRVLIASPAYLENRTPPRHPSELADWDWIGLRPIDNRSVFEKPGHEPARLRMSPRLVVDSAIALVHLSRAGCGLSIVPEFLAADDIARGNIQVVLSDWQVKTAGIYAVWPANAPKRGLTQQFIEYLSDRSD